MKSPARRRFTLAALAPTLTVGLLPALAKAAMPSSNTPSATTSTAGPAPATAPAAPAVDPHLWLEDVGSDASLAWVRARNAETRAVLEQQPEFAPTRDRIRAILDSREKIPAVRRRGPWLYNLWQDEQNPRGLWRRTGFDSFRTAAPVWETVLDLDALGRAEGENWVWGGADVLGPDYRYALVELSRGGADATVVREFDLHTRRFVADGFQLPEAKSSASWDQDSSAIFVGTDFGPGSLTDSGYPRTVRRWRRGQPLSQAVTIYEGQASDVSVWASADRTPGFERTLVGRFIDFYRSEMFLLQGERLVPLPKPVDASLGFWRAHVTLELRSDWTVEGRTWPRGSLLTALADDYLAGRARWQALFTPTGTASLSAFTSTATRLVLNVLDNVASRLEEWTPPAVGPGPWTRRALAAPHPGTLSVAALHDDQVPGDPLAEHLLLDYTDFLTPDSLLLATAGTDRLETLKSRPRHFDATGMRVEQRFATSRDGTRVPYFVIWPAAAASGAAPGPRPTLLYGYGGFEQSMQPFYSGGVGNAWLARGGVYVLANIRGGGEFGPAWHQAAVKHQRQKSYDDFIAVAEHLVAGGVTRPSQLGIMGGSNGGLLVGAVMMQRPELFGAVVCQVPLLDMQRYHLLLAGASWMAEYGNPEVPEDWAAISRYSPYQNARAGLPLPPVLFITSTRDDRVHPGHARKMTARLLELGYPGARAGGVHYYENIEGGHGGAADNAQRADMSALEFAFLWRSLRPR